MDNLVGIADQERAETIQRPDHYIDRLPESTITMHHFRGNPRPHPLQELDHMNRSYDRFEYRDLCSDIDKFNVIPDVYLQSEDGYGIFNHSSRQFIRINGVAEWFGGTVHGPYVDDVPTSAERTEFMGWHFTGKVVGVLILFNQAEGAFKHAGAWAGGRLSMTPFVEWKKDIAREARMLVNS
ncbi:hypothetical protein BDV98DRAFT_568471 [Pterulicium gracile]|uniref:Uncharacterized protein n=1 Tax=Pterulicium gracile TaxID=1884261 RepID=A0A5C3QIH9_9AGAR|nr:hypothetical protein BDV98DRAFT_568471 [Pterula gracilis]